MTASELIAILQQYHPDTPLARSCGGDCPGYTELCQPRMEVLFHSPDENQTYQGELADDFGYQSSMRSRDPELHTDSYDWMKRYPTPTGTEYLVF